MLLHVCCASCAAYPIKLLEPDFDITMFFYNPNIHPRKEYIKRLESVKKLSDISGIVFIESDYDIVLWSSRVKGTENEPEGGKRCRFCFDMRLKKTASTAKEKHMDIFATTMSISPHKNSKVINVAASTISEAMGVQYYTSDLKKKDGFKKTNELSRTYGLYHQDYCGCNYSIRK